jgi:hypothetical protein
MLFLINDSRLTVHHLSIHCIVAVTYTYERYPPKKLNRSFLSEHKMKIFTSIWEHEKIWRGAWGMLLLLSFEDVTVVLLLTTKRPSYEKTRYISRQKSVPNKQIKCHVDSYALSENASAASASRKSSWSIVLSSTVQGSNLTQAECWERAPNEAWTSGKSAVAREIQKNVLPGLFARILSTLLIQFVASSTQQPNDYLHII